MNVKCLLSLIVILWSTSHPALADRQLERAEILHMFEELTNQPRGTWIPAGMIEATHEEYRAPRITDPNQINEQIYQKIQEYQANSNKPERTESLQKMRLDAIPFNVRSKLSNEYTMSSTVIVRFDGDRFYWEINVDSRTDSVRPGRDLMSNSMTRHFDLDWNARRIFAWDGEKYTTYSASGNHATIDSTSATPHTVNGPLTAGIVPWGHGYCTYEELAAAESSAVETYVNGQTEIHLTLNNSDGVEMTFALDPEKDYAITSCSITGARNTLHSRQFAGYRLVSGQWVPTTILVERYDADTNRLLASDLWSFTNVSGDVPASESLNVEFETDALVEYSSSVTDSPLIYRCSETVDTEKLLSERLLVAAFEGIEPQNCATIAMRYATSQLGMDVTDEQLAQLIRDPNQDTALGDMKAFAEGLGLYCRALKTDIQTLKMLGGCQIILHIPGKEHFVVLGGIDNDSVWTIDLTNNRFLCRIDLSIFGMDWTEGTALVMSDKPIDVQGSYTEIEHSQLGEIVGATGYTCTRIIQQYYLVYCSYLGGCWGWFEVHYTRLGCEAAPSGSCIGSFLIRYAESPCIDYPYRFETCTVTDEWTLYYMRACG